MDDFLNLGAEMATGPNYSYIHEHYSMDFESAVEFSDASSQDYCLETTTSDASSSSDPMDFVADDASPWHEPGYLHLDDDVGSGEAVGEAFGSHDFGNEMAYYAENVAEDEEMDESDEEDDGYETDEEADDLMTLVLVLTNTRDVARAA